MRVFEARWIGVGVCVFDVKLGVVGGGGFGLGDL